MLAHRLVRSSRVGRDRLASPTWPSGHKGFQSQIYKALVKPRWLAIEVFHHDVQILANRNALGQTHLMVFFSQSADYTQADTLRETTAGFVQNFDASRQNLIARCQYFLLGRDGRDGNGN